MIPSKILIVEDEIVSAKSLEIHLNKMGHTILGTATSGEKAIQMALASQPDLVLMDIKLSGEMDGIQAAGHIREHINVAIIYLTAHSGDETVQRALSTEPFGYLIKPFDPNELRIIIEVTLYKHRLQQQLTDALTNVRRSQQRY